MSESNGLQAMCYAIDHVITTGANCTAQGPCYYKDICPTEKAGGVHAVCYPINLMVATRGGRDDMRTCFGIGEANDPQFTLSATHEHGVCYVVYPGNSITSPINGNNPQPGDPCPTLTDDSRYYLVGEKHE